MPPRLPWWGFATTPRLARAQVKEVVLAGLWPLIVRSPRQLDIIPAAVTGRPFVTFVHGSPGLGESLGSSGNVPNEYLSYHSHPNAWRHKHVIT